MVSTGANHKPKVLADRNAVLADHIFRAKFRFYYEPNMQDYLF